MFRFKKNIWNDNHLLRKIQRLLGLGGVNYKLSFEASEVEGAVDNLRPEKLKLEVFNEKEPYNLIHSGRIDVSYSNNISLNFDVLGSYKPDADFIIYGGRGYSSSPSIFTVGDVDINKQDYLNNFFFNVDDLEGSITVLDVHKLFGMDKFDVHLFDKNYRNVEFKDSQGNGLNNPLFMLYYPDYINNENVVFGFLETPGKDIKAFDNTTNTEINTTIYYDKYVNRIEPSIYDLDGNMFMGFEEIKEVNFSKELYLNPFIINKRIYHLTDKLLTGYFGIELEVASINEAETDDNSTIIENISFTPVFNITPAADLNTGLSFNLIHKEFEVKVYIPFNNLTGQGYSVDYIDDLGNLQQSQDFSFDFDNIEIIVEKQYTDRVENLDYKLINTTIEKVKEQA